MKYLRSRVPRKLRTHISRARVARRGIVVIFISKATMGRWVEGLKNSITL